MFGLFKVVEDYLSKGTSDNASLLEQGGFVNVESLLDNFDLDNLDPYESMVYAHAIKSMDKKSALQTIINTVEGDYSQLSDGLAKIAEIQYPQWKHDEDANSENYAKGGGVEDSDLKDKLVYISISREIYEGVKKDSVIDFYYWKNLESVYPEETSTIGYYWEKQKEKELGGYHQFEQKYYQWDEEYGYPYEIAKKVYDKLNNFDRTRNGIAIIDLETRQPILRQRWNEYVLGRGFHHKEDILTPKFAKGGGFVPYHKYALGDKYRTKFDYGGLFDMAKDVTVKWSVSDLKKLSSSLESTNYHTFNAILEKAIHQLENNQISEAEETLEIFKSEISGDGQFANGGGIEFDYFEVNHYPSNSEPYITYEKQGVWQTQPSNSKKITKEEYENHSKYYAKGGKVDNTFNYMMLSRLQSDCDYYLGYGNRASHLWASDVDSHIKEMKRLWNNLPIKPEWLSMEQIEEYEKKMKDDSGSRQNYAQGGALSEDIQMAKSDVMKLDEYAKKISDSVMPNQDVEAWVISKISKVEQTTANVKHTLEAEYPEMFAIGGEIEHTDGNTVRMMCLHIGKYAKSILKVIDKGIEFESWMKHELSIASSMIDNVFHYLDYFNSKNHLAKGGSIENKIDELYASSNFINDDFNWKLKLLEMLQEKSFEAYKIYQSLTEKEKQEVLQELYQMDNDMGSDGDGDIETSKENLLILLEDAKGCELTRGEIENKIEGLKLRIAKTKKQISTYETTQRGKYNKLFKEKLEPLQEELSALGDLWGKAKYSKGGGVTEFDIPNTLLTETVNVKMAKGGGVKSEKKPTVSQLHKKFSEEKKSIAINIITDAIANKLMHDNNKSVNFEQLSDTEKKEFNEYYDKRYNATSKFLLKSFLEKYYSDKDTREKCKGDGVKARDAIYSVVNEIGKAMKPLKFKSSKMANGGIISSFRLPASDEIPIGLGGIPTYNTPSDIELLRL